MDFAKLVFEAKPFEGVFVFDVHGHVGTSGSAQFTNTSSDGIAHTLDRLGVDGICVSSQMSLFSDWKFGNEETAAACKKHPGKIFGYATPNPFDPNCDLRPYFETDMGFRGVKIHGCAQGATPENDPRYSHAYELANALGLPVLFHAWERQEILRAADVARQYPNCKVILGHAGMTNLDTAAEVCRTYDNMFCDTAISMTVDGAMERLVDQIGADRVLYGSDMAYFDCTQTLGKLALAKLSDDVKEKILGKNAATIFKL